MKEYGHAIRRISFMDTKSIGFSSKKLTVLIISTIVISTVMSSVVAAPAPHNMRHKRQLLKNACTADFVNGTMKNNDPNVLGTLLFQMRLIIADFKNINRTYIAPNYDPVAKLAHQISDNKLPKNQFPAYQKFRKLHLKMNKKNMIRIWLPKLFNRLHIYGVAFRKLYDTKPHTNNADFQHDKRKTTIQHIIDQHRALVCEVETSFDDADAKNKQKSKSNINSDIDWPENPDLTTIYTRDLSVFSLYSEFLKDWQKILRQIDSIGKHKASYEGLRRNLPRRRLKNKVVTPT